MPVLDANVIIRFLANVHPDHSLRSREFFRSLEAGERSVYLPEGVLVEVVYSMTSPNLHHVDREEMHTKLGFIISMPSIDLPNKRLYLRALDLFVAYRRLSFMDALCISHAEHLGDSTVITFDRGYRNIEGVTREEP